MHASRIALGMPDGGRDFAYGDAFPHEALHGSARAASRSSKGCYIGQEVVPAHAASRHRPHRASSPVVPRRAASVPETRRRGAPPAQPARLHRLRRQRARALAMLRLDRVADALAARRDAHAAAGLALRRQARPDPLPVPRRARLAEQPHERPRAEDCQCRCPTASSAAAGPAPIRSISPITTPNGACRNTIDRALFEKLMLDGFQAGLVVDHHPAQARHFPQGLRRFRAGQDRPLRRDEARSADAATPASSATAAKIEGAMQVARRAYLDAMQKRPSFSDFLWDFVDGAPMQNRLHGHAARSRPRPSESQGDLRRS